MLLRVTSRHPHPGAGLPFQVCILLPLLATPTPTLRHSLFPWHVRLSPMSVSFPCVFFSYYWITFLHNFWLKNSYSSFKTRIKHHLPCDVYPPRYSCSLFWIVTFCLFVCFVYASSYACSFFPLDYFYVPFMTLGISKTKLESWALQSPWEAGPHFWWGISVVEQSGRIKGRL